MEKLALEPFPWFSMCLTVQKFGWQLSSSFHFLQISLDSSVARSSSAKPICLAKSVASSPAKMLCLVWSKTYTQSPYLCLVIIIDQDQFCHLSGHRDGRLDPSEARNGANVGSGAGIKVMSHPNHFYSIPYFSLSLTDPSMIIASSVVSPFSSGEPP